MARFNRLAEEADCSEKTVQRALKFLKATNWLVQVGDGRDDNGKYTHGTYRFTETVACLLALPTASISPQQTKMSDGLYIELSLLKDQPGTPGDSSLKKEDQPQPKITLPPELAKLPEELGIKDTGIAKLRGLAFKAGHQLEHIVACAKQRLLETGAKGGRAFRYLQTMIDRKSDYAGRAAQEARKAEDKAVVDRRKETEEKHADKRYVAPNGMTYRFLGTSGTAEVTYNGVIQDPVAGQQVLELYEMIAAGKLTEAVANTPATAPAQLPQRDSWTLLGDEKAPGLALEATSPKQAQEAEAPITPANTAKSKPNLREAMAKMNAGVSTDTMEERRKANTAKYAAVFNRDKPAMLTEQGV